MPQIDYKFENLNCKYAYATRHSKLGDLWTDAKFLLLLSNLNVHRVANLCIL